MYTGFMRFYILSFLALSVTLLALSFGREKLFQPPVFVSRGTETFSRTIEYVVREDALPDGSFTLRLTNDPGVVSLHEKTANHARRLRAFFVTRGDGTDLIIEGAHPHNFYKLTTPLTVTAGVSRLEWADNDTLLVLGASASGTPATAIVNVVLPTFQLYPGNRLSAGRTHAGRYSEVVP